MSGTRPLLRELISIPERVQTNDFVLKLSEGVTEEAAARTIDAYVVTPQLARAFDQALGFVGGAIEGGKSAACYLHGSFGAGKSHFMAVLNLLLAGYPRARGVPALAAAVNKHDRWLAGRRFLMVPFHMIEASDVTSAILGGYAAHVRRLHPSAPVPGFYLGEHLFRDAAALRRDLGDERFLARLNERADAGDTEWGDFEADWTATTYDQAVLEPPEGLGRQSLVGRLIATYFASYASVAATQGAAFVSFDTGLAIMSRHAQALGYDAVILFLDELILWLATRAGNVEFVNVEGSKLSKLVEAQDADRPVPIISLVARQRDLRELIGEHHPGADQARFEDTLKYFEARFDKISLEDRNLPEIASKRLLAPVSDTARQAIEAEFERLIRTGRTAVETLLGADAEQELFRKIYPFSPALVQVLIAASSVLQRERTALKLMLTLLVRRRDELRLGSLIPVGDLWDEIASGDQPFSDGMRMEFERAKRLWTQKLAPLLEAEHNVIWQDLQDGRADPGVARRFDNDARLLKTLLLAALVPEVPALRALTAQRLAALNHGSVTSPVAGGEGGIVLQKLQRWASQVGEIRIGDGQQRIVSLQISGVDVEPVLANASSADNDGQRRSRLQRLVFDMLGLGEDDTLTASQPFVSYEHAWRGTKRSVDLYFESVRDLSHDRLRGRADAPVLVLGIPFDVRGRSPADHLAHAREFDDGGPPGGPAGGAVWQPSYLSDRAMADLGVLVRIDFLLAGDGRRLAEAAPMLSASDREQARSILRTRQSALQQRVRACLEAAYGLRPDTEGCVGTTVAAGDGLVALDGTFRPQMPVGADLQGAVGALLDRVFEHKYPAHPVFDGEVKDAAIRRVLDRVEAAASAPDQRLSIEDRNDRTSLAAIAVPLRLGVMSQTSLSLTNHWADHFATMQARSGGAALTVGQLRRWIDEPRMMGLQTRAQNLVVLAFAAQADRTFVRNGAPAAASLDRLDDALELREEPLPDEAAWTRARARAEALFGLRPAEIRKGATMAALAASIADAATARQTAVADLLRELRGRAAAFGVAPTAPRLATLRSAQALLADIVGAGTPLARVEALAAAELETSEAAVARLLAAAPDLQAAVAHAEWGLIETAATLTDNRQAAAQGLLDRLAEALDADEHAVPLKPVLRDSQTRASRLLSDSRSGSTPPAPEPPDAPPPPGEELVNERTQVVLNAAAATAALDALRDQIADVPGAKLTIAWRLTRPSGGRAP